MSSSIVLIEDHAIVREGLRSLLEREADLRVVGEANNGRAGIRMVREKKPDLVIMDISMPELNGVEATRRIAVDSDGTKVICLSMHDESIFVQSVLEAGASGYVVKKDGSSEIVHAVRAVRDGGTYLSPSIAGCTAADGVKGRRKAATRTWHDLSEREMEVLQLIAEGHSTKEIAAELGLSGKTVAVHREHIMGKLNLFSVVALARYALREGLTEL